MKNSSKNSSIKNFFKNSEIFEKALTHKSWVNEHKNNRGSNERLEFLGDAILEFVVSEKLFKKYPNDDEGVLTALRANIVNTDHLSAVAKRICIGELIFLSKGEEESGGRENDSLLADTIEAIIGGIFIDEGLDKVKEFIEIFILSDLDNIEKKPLKDAKSTLQEVVQAHKYPTPVYKVVSEEGPDHDKIFIIDVLVNNKSKGRGKGKSKNDAEQMAAMDALKHYL